MSEMIYRGSVKDIYLGKNDGEVTFKFSDRYSIFDWGEMPDQLERKGEALAHMSAFFFKMLSDTKTWSNWPLDTKDHDLSKELELICKNGYPTHFLRQSDPQSIDVMKVDVIHPEFDNGKWDYHAYKEKFENTLVPLEMIFRFGMPRGSSLKKRINDESYLRELGLDSTPEFGDEFVTPIIEFSTKLETTDRYIPYQEAKEIAGLSDEEFTSLLNRVKLTAIRLKDLFEEMEVKLWDGKFEFAFGEMEGKNRQFILVDSIGPDELRLTYEGVPLSKENLRHFYRDGKWHKDLENAKEIASKRGEKDWKKVCISELESTPPQLSEEYKEQSISIYTAISNQLEALGGNSLVFENSRNLKEVSSFFKEQML